MFQERSGTSQCCQVEQGVRDKKCGSDKQVIVGAQGAYKVALWRDQRSGELGCVTSCGWNLHREVYYWY